MYETCPGALMAPCLDGLSALMSNVGGLFWSQSMFGQWPCPARRAFRDVCRTGCDRLEESRLPTRWTAELHASVDSPSSARLHRPILFPQPIIQLIIQRDNASSPFSGPLAPLSTVSPPKRAKIGTIQGRHEDGSSHHHALPLTDT
jgi:hypothetical protein